MKVHLHHFSKIKSQKESQKSTGRNQGFSYYFCMMIEGSGSGSRFGSIPLTNGSGSGRPKNMWIRWIRIRMRIHPQHWLWCCKSENVANPFVHSNFSFDSFVQFRLCLYFCLGVKITLVKMLWKLAQYILKFNCLLILFNFFRSCLSNKILKSLKLIVPYSLGLWSVNYNDVMFSNLLHWSKYFLQVFTD